MPGSDADFTVIDLEQEWVVDGSKTWTKSKYTPFHRMKLKGKIDKTIVRGHLIYDHGKVVGEPGTGEYVKRQRISHLKRKIILIIKDEEGEKMLRSKIVF